MLRLPYIPPPLRQCQPRDPGGGGTRACAHACSNLKGNRARLINHLCGPNCEARKQGSHTHTRTRTHARAHVCMPHPAGQPRALHQSLLRPQLRDPEVAGPGRAGHRAVRAEGEGGHALHMHAQQAWLPGPALCWAALCWAALCWAGFAASLLPPPRPMAGLGF